MKLAGWGSGLLDVLMPAGCVSCRAWVPGGPRAPLICALCRSRLREASWPRCPRCHHPRGTGRTDAPDCLECRDWSPALDAARFAYVLAPPADDLVHSLKYEGWSELAAFMGRSLSALPLPGALDGRRSVVVPVPTTRTRLRRRGYNQAELLAVRVAQGRGLPLHDALTRRGSGRSQTDLTPAERRENVRGVFRPANGCRRLVRRAHVLLVDDVLTTGATASEAASTLSDAGAATVTLLAFGRALPAASEGPFHGLS